MHIGNVPNAIAIMITGVNFHFSFRFSYKIFFQFFNFVQFDQVVYKNRHVVEKTPDYYKLNLFKSGTKLYLSYISS